MDVSSPRPLQLTNTADGTGITLISGPICSTPSTLPATPSLIVVSLTPTSVRSRTWSAILARFNLHSNTCSKQALFLGGIGLTASSSENRASPRFSVDEIDFASSLLVKIWLYPTLQPDTWTAAFLFPRIDPRASPVQKNRTGQTTNIAVKLFLKEHPSHARN